MGPKTSIQSFIEKHVRDPELKLLLLNNPDLLPLFSQINAQFAHYEEQLIRYQERLRFNLRDMETAKQAKINQVKNLTFQAYHDSLTGLPNRNYLFERIEAAILQAHRTSNPFALMFIDLDGFKFINDNYGHDFGDMLLRLVASRLKETTRETDMVARLAGDEFCLLLMNMESPAQSARVASAIFKAFEEPMELDGHDFQINMSIGISHYPHDGQTTKQLMKNADVAMYEAKKRGSNLFQFYEQRLTEKVAERLEFEQDLSKAIKNDELRLLLTPNLNLSTGELDAVDVNMVWQHPDRGTVQSSLFYQGITNSHLLMPILRWQIQRCCELQQVWAMRNYPIARLRIAVDYRQFHNKEFFKYIDQAKSAIQHTSTDIELLIEESTLTRKPDQAKRQLVQCHLHGFKTAIHFTAQGFLPIETLQSCELNSLVLNHQNLAEYDQTRQLDIIQGMSSLSKAIGIQISIKGVNSKQLTDFYSKQELTIQSGSYFSEDISVEDFESVLKRFADSKESAFDLSLFSKVG